MILTTDRWRELLSERPDPVAVIFRCPDADEDHWILRTARRLEAQGIRVYHLDARANAGLAEALGVRGAPALVAYAGREEVFRLGRVSEAGSRERLPSGP